jgi:hypothetical protein
MQKNSKNSNGLKDWDGYVIPTETFMKNLECLCVPKIKHILEEKIPGISLRLYNLKCKAKNFESYAEEFQNNNSNIIRYLKTILGIHIKNIEYIKRKSAGSTSEIKTINVYLQSEHKKYLQITDSGYIRGIICVSGSKNNTTLPNVLNPRIKFINNQFDLPGINRSAKSRKTNICLEGILAVPSEPQLIIKFFRDPVFLNKFHKFIGQKLIFE